MIHLFLKININPALSGTAKEIFYNAKISLIFYNVVKTLDFGEKGSALAHDNIITFNKIF